MLDVPPVKYTRRAGTQVAYQVVGDGPVDLLVAPGFISHLDLQWTMPTFATWVEQLAEFSRVILFDKSGTGLSDPSPEAARFDQRVADIDAILEAAESQHAVLLGMSEGGPLSVLYAATRPERVRSLVLLGTFAAGASISPDVLAQFDEAVENWGEGLTSKVFLSAESQRTFAQRYFGLFERASCSPGMARMLFESIKGVDVRTLLPSLTMPTLLLRRVDDPFAAREWTDELERLIPRSVRIEVEGEDHLPWLGDARPIASAISEFVTGHGTRPRRGGTVASVLFTDIVDSTRHAVDMGDDAWLAVLSEHNMLVRSVIDRYRGQEVKSTGDGFLGLFATPGHAVRCAEEVVESVRSLGIEIRAGIHTGEVELLGATDIAGLAVHLAARVGARAGAGEVLVSETVLKLLAGDTLAFRSRGAHRLKGIPDRVRLFALDGRKEAPSVTGERLTTFTDRVAMRALRGAAGARRSLDRLVSRDGGLHRPAGASAS